MSASGASQILQVRELDDDQGGSDAEACARPISPMEMTKETGDVSRISEKSEQMVDKKRKAITPDGDEGVPDIPTLEDGVKRRGRFSRKSMESKSYWSKVTGAAGELNKDTKKVYNFLKSKLSRKRRSKETEVKSIHIVPDDSDKWAQRSASSAASRESNESSYSGCSREDDGIEIVDDLGDTSFPGCSY